MKVKILFFLFFFLCNISAGYSFNGEDRYDLQFTQLGKMGSLISIDILNNELMKWALVTLPLSKSDVRIDSTMQIAGKYPTMLDLKRKKRDPIEIYMMQEIKIPEKYSKKKAKITVTVNCKNENIDSLLLSLLTIDRYENPQQCLTFDVGSKDWK